MSYEIQYDDIYYNDLNGILVFDAVPIFTDERFDAYNGAGMLELFGEQNALTDFELDGKATFFAIGNNGEEIGEYQLEIEEVLDLIDHDLVIQELVNKHY